MVIRDKTSREWQNVKRWAEGELAEARRQNDGDLNMEDTNKVRGRIGAILDLLELENVDSPANVPTARYID